MKLPNADYINLIKEFSRAWFKLRDQRSVLGFLWSFLNPLIMTTILFFLFKSRIMAGHESNYFLYILIGNVVWGFFTIATTMGLASIIDNSRLVKNAAFPKEIVVYGSIGTFIIQYFFELLTLFLVIAILGAGFSIHIIILPLIIVVEILLIIGISLFLSCLCVYAFDLKHIWAVAMRMAFFITPIFYKSSDISLPFRWIVEINPMSQIIIFSRDILLYHRTPSLLNLTVVSVFSLFIATAGYKFFKRYEYRIVEKV